VYVRKHLVLELQLPRTSISILYRFLPWRHLTTLVYSAPIENEEALHQRMFDACQSIRNRPETFEMVQQSVIQVKDILSVINCNLINSKK
jgi:hypothetical protein